MGKQPELNVSWRERQVFWSHILLAPQSGILCRAGKDQGVDSAKGSDADYNNPSN